MGRWAAGAPALIVFVWLSASCPSSVTTAALSVGEGTKWKSGSSSSGVYPSNTWDKVTAVLEEAKKNATFPGIGKVLVCSHV